MFEEPVVADREPDDRREADQRGMQPPTDPIGRLRSVHTNNRKPPQINTTTSADEASFRTAAAPPLNRPVIQ